MPAPALPADEPGSPPPRRGDVWADLRHRLGAYPVLKGVGTTLGMTLFFVAYFHLLQNPIFPVTEMPRTALDRWIPFTPAALWIYFTLWPYVALPPALLTTRRALGRYALSIGSLCTVGLAIFWLWPTAVPPPEVELAAHPGFGVLRGVDAAGNACPSLHVATAVFSAVWLHRLLGELRAGAAWRVANAAWVTAIVWSTLAVRQHVVLDVVGGFLLALPFAVPALGGRPGAVGAYDAVEAPVLADGRQGAVEGRGNNR